MRKLISTRICLVVMLGIPCATARAGLLAYVAKPDPSYAWSQVGESPAEALLQHAELYMVSQTWRGTPWKHRLLVARPAGMKDSAHVLLIIGGGSWHEGQEKERMSQDAKELKLATAIAAAARMPVAFLSHVPFQPLFGGLKEDQIIA